MTLSKNLVRAAILCVTCHAVLSAAKDCPPGSATSCPLRKLIKKDPLFQEQTLSQYPEMLLDERVFFVPDPDSGDTLQDMKPFRGEFFRDIVPKYIPAVMPLKDVKNVEKLFKYKDGKKFWKDNKNDKLIFEGPNKDYFWGYRTDAPGSTKVEAYSHTNAPKESFDTLYNEGFTFILLHSSYWLPVFRPIFHALESLLGMEFDSSTFVAPPNARSSIDIHIDGTEVFIVNIAGTKTFRLWDPKDFGEHFPMHPLIKLHKPELNTGMAGYPTLEVTLGAGDMLYIPHGWVHDVHTGNSTSIHLSCGAEPDRLKWFAVLGGFIKARRDEPVRSALEIRIPNSRLHYTHLLSACIYMLNFEVMELRMIAPVVMSARVQEKYKDRFYPVYKKLVQRIKKIVSKESFSPYKLICQSPTEPYEYSTPHIPPQMVSYMGGMEWEVAEIEQWCANEDNVQLRFPNKELKKYFKEMAGKWDSWMKILVDKEWARSLNKEYGRLKA